MSDSIRFLSKRRGYDPQQVDNRIEALDKEINDLRRQSEFYRRQALLQAKQLEQIRTAYQDLIDDLQLKEQAAQKLSRIAMKEASRIIDAAQVNADVIVKDALVSARGLLLDATRISKDAQGNRARIFEKLNQLTETIKDFTIEPLPKAEEED
ncbi:MAG: DivIVA domain-containing protein [Erysipelotrichaceae bacterium]|jgi:cell division initiation protein|nr:DivIVA domain-containing protein [Erysipelotrichaceae bacterium]